MYLNLYHRAAFTAALLNNQSMGFYSVDVLVWDVRRHGVGFKPVRINRTGARCTLEGGPPAAWVGFARVKGVGTAAAETIACARERNGPYHSLADCCHRTGLPSKAIEALVLAGAFDGCGRSRDELLWDAYAFAGVGRAAELELPEERPALPARPEHEQTLLDYAVLGFSLGRHLVEHYRRLAGLRVVPTTELARWPDGKPVRVGGLVVCRQAPPTAKGFLFLTVEDGRRLVNVIVRPDVYARYRPILRDQPLVAIAGRVQRSHGIVNVVAERAVALDLGMPDPEQAAEQASPVVRPAFVSHDFR
jgi:error-prone DNA polymerase